MKMQYEQEPLATPLSLVAREEPHAGQTRTEELKCHSQGKSKRVVSKSEYAANVGRKTATASVGIGLVGIGLVCALVVGLIVFLFIKVAKPSDAPDLLFVLMLMGILAYGTHYLFRLGLRSIREARKIHPGVPLTRANTADLPPPDSLVRASQEPIETQDAVLLRAAIGAQEGHETGELLRASAGE